MQILDAEPADAPNILILQKLAYASEAELVGTADIEPLRQTQADILRDMAAGTMLKVVDGATIIGSVRARKDSESVLVGKLMVHPDHQGQGLGRALLAAIESRYPGSRFELFTSSRSVRNIAFYRKAGYRETGVKRISQSLTLVTMAKI